MHISNHPLALHSIMCSIGGFLGGYAILTRFGNLGAAQTSNMIELVLDFVGRNYADFALRIIGFILYASAFVLVTYLSKQTDLSMQRYAISIDIAGMIILSLIPADVNPIIGLLPLFFMMSTQWSVFHGFGEYNSSTIFSTNNLRQLTISLTEYCMEHEPKKLIRAKFFGNSLLWYHVGAAVSFFACKYFAVHGVLCALPAAAAALVLTLECRILPVTHPKKA